MNPFLLTGGAFHYALTGGIICGLFPPPDTVSLESLFLLTKCGIFASGIRQCAECPVSFLLKCEIEFIVQAHK